jgi:hypothetical protein
MVNKKVLLGMIGLCLGAIHILFLNQTTAETFKTNHYEFVAGSMREYNEEEKETIKALVSRLDDIWSSVNLLCDNKLPRKIRISVQGEGRLSIPLPEENSILINLIKIKNGLRDCLTIIAHETTHIGYHKISNGRITDWENKFLDEGIAMYAMYPYEPDVADKKGLSLRIAKDDLKNGNASLNYLRDWKNNVQDKLVAFSNTWRVKNPNKEPSLEDELKAGVNSYYTSCVLIEYLLDTYGLPKLVGAIRNIGKGVPQSKAFQSALGKNIEEIFTEWHASLYKPK